MPSVLHRGGWQGHNIQPGEKKSHSIASKQLDACNTDCRKQTKIRPVSTEVTACFRNIAAKCQRAIRRATRLALRTRVLDLL